MATILHQTVRDYIHNENNIKRFLREDDAAVYFSMNKEELNIFASAAGAIYRFSRIVLISRKRLEDYMKHIYKVPNTGKYVQKKMVRIGEGSIIYSIGHHRFIEMARDAGAVYKINGSVFISLERFDEYLEQFREARVPMKNPLWRKED